MTSVICPYCRKKTKYVPDKNRYYCSKCRKYVPKFLKSKKKEDNVKKSIKCVYCGAIADYVKSQKSYYCKNCKKYVPEKTEPIKETIPVNEKKGFFSKISAFLKRLFSTK